LKRPPFHRQPLFPWLREGLSFFKFVCPSWNIFPASGSPDLELFAASSVSLFVLLLVEPASSPSRLTVSLSPASRSPARSFHVHCSPISSPVFEVRTSTSVNPPRLPPPPLSIQTLRVTQTDVLPKKHTPSCPKILEIGGSSIFVNYPLPFFSFLLSFSLIRFVFLLIFPVPLSFSRSYTNVRRLPFRCSFLFLGSLVWARSTFFISHVLLYPSFCPQKRNGDSQVVGRNRSLPGSLVNRNCSRCPFFRRFSISRTPASLFNFRAKSVLSQYSQDSRL